jgi:DNA-binding response OmpR family regulator
MIALVGDDSRATRTMLRTMLSNLGFGVIDGLELVRSIRAERRFAELPVMMVTAETDTNQMARALMAGADEYALKPLDQESLVSKLKMLGLLQDPEPIA